MTSELLDIFQWAIITILCITVSHLYSRMEKLDSKKSNK